MEMSTSAASRTPSSAASRTPDPATGGYRPGVCNIGPAEITRRRRVGHAGIIAPILVWLVFALARSPSGARLFAALPAAVAASGYLQAWLRFCAGFGSRGIFNFGPLGETQAVEDAGARARDRRKANQIGLASLLVGIAVGVVAALLPL